MNGGERPLLSLAIYTYNQERFVKETLDSLLPGSREEAEGKTEELLELLKRTELIVSDDGSSDGTPEVVERWIDHHGHLFAACGLLRGDQNVGPVRNYTRAVRACSGEIIKPLAGDDLFSLSGLTRAVQEMISHREVAVLFGQIIPFTDSPSPEKSVWTEEQRDFFASEVFGQFRMLVSFDPLPAPGGFFRRELFELLRLWEYDFFWMEDWPLWLLATAQGYRMYVLDFPVVFYRVHQASLSQRMNAKGREKVRRGINRDRRRMYDEIVFPRMGEFPFLLRHHIRLRRFFFAWLERTEHPGLVHWMRSFSLFIDPCRIGRKISGTFGRRRESDS